MAGARRRPADRRRPPARLAGLLLILVPALCYTRSTPFPGLSALPPCLGAALLLHVGGSGPNGVTRLLSWQPLVFVGLISYSLYLWHWPVLELYRYYTQDAPGAGTTAVLLGAAFLLAIASWRWIEQPFRIRRSGRQRLRRTPLLVLSAAALGAVVLLGTAVDLDHGWPGRFPATLIAQQRASLREPWDECLMDAEDDRRGRYASCVRGATGPIRVAVIGDSHALAILPGLVAQADAVRQRVIFFGHGGCPPALGIDRVDGYRRPCDAFARWALKRIGRDRRIGTVIFVARLPAYVEGSNFGPAERHLPPPAFVRAGSARIGPNTVLVREGMLAAVSAMRRAGKRTVLVYPVPEVGRNVPQLVSRAALLGSAEREGSFDERLFRARAYRTYRLLDELARAMGAIRVRPEDRLCERGRCRIAIRGMPLYKDNNHLSVMGAYAVGPLFNPFFRSAAAGGSSGPGRARLVASGLSGSVPASYGSPFPAPEKSP